MLEGASEKGLGFIKRQHQTFKVNIARNLMTNFSLDLETPYPLIYIAELGAGPVERGYINSISGVATTLMTLPVGWINLGVTCPKLSILFPCLPILGEACNHADDS